MARKKSQRKRELEAAAAAKSDTGGATAAAAKPPATPTARGDGSKVAPAKTVMGLSINRSFAEKYEAIKRKQEAGRLRDLGVNLAALKRDDGDEEASGDEEEEEEEDEHAELLTRRVNKEISETLAKIRARDPAIYDPTARFYKADKRGAKGGGGAPAGVSGGAGGDGTAGVSGGAASAAATAGDGGSSDDDSSFDSEDEPLAGWDTIARTALEAVTPKPVHIKDYVRERLLEDGKLESEESDEEVPRARKSSVAAAPHATLYNAEQIELKQSLVAAGESSDDDDAEEAGGGEGGDGDASGEDDSDDFFTIRKRSSADDAAEEADFAAFQVKEGAALAREDGEQRLLHAYLENETPDEKEYFLREFVMNNGWLGGERHKAPRHGDSAFEVDKTVIDRGPGGPAVKDGVGDADADADPLDDDAAFVDNQELFEYGHNFRYEDEKAAEIVAHARTVAGSLRRKSDGRRKAREARRAAKAAARSAAVEEVKRQKNVLASEINERLREVEAAAGTAVTDASAWDLDGDWDPDAYAKAMDAQFGDDYYAAAKETEADVRADAIAEEAEEDEDGASSKSKKRKSAKAGAAAGSTAAASTQTDGKLMSLMEQYQGLDFEDIVGGERLRFAYRQVPADTFGLSAAEILESEDKELNRKVSLRYYAPYRQGRPGPERARQQDKRSRGHVRDGNGGAPAGRTAAARPSRGGDGRSRRDSAGANAARPPPSAAADGGDKDKKKKRKRDDAASAVAEPTATPTAAALAAAAAASAAGGVTGDASRKRSKVDKDDMKRKPDAATPAPEVAAPAAPPPAADGAPKHKRSKHAKKRTKKRDANRQAASSALSDSRLRAYAL